LQVAERRAGHGRWTVLLRQSLSHTRSGLGLQGRGRGGKGEPAPRFARNPRE
jgi:hypothetical protein